MMDAVRQTTISEAMLFFVLLFVLPGMAFLVWNLRKYEKMLNGREKPAEKRKRKERGKTSSFAPPKKSDGVFPYKSRQFLSPRETACLAALREVLAADAVDVFAKTALWELVEPADKDPAYAERLHGLDFDFLICDRITGQPLTAVMFNPGKGRSNDQADLLRKICEAAETHVVFIDMAESYDAKSLKESLGIPDLEM
ncbi:MAG: DUF2726 domain-containing protein [Planctomycetota bacterium]|jgi:hypothetical protein|nr:DUF2726 domain-containing protein [Planctomycetota bacterium]